MVYVEFFHFLHSVFFGSKALEMLSLGPKQRDDQLKITEFLYLGKAHGDLNPSAVFLRGSVCVRFHFAI